LASPSTSAVIINGVTPLAAVSAAVIRVLLGIVTTLAGNGTATFANGTGAAARFNGPKGVAVTSTGDIVVADPGNNRIRLVTPGGVVSTLAGQTTAGFGDGTGAAASFNEPYGVAVIPSSGVIVVADTGNNRIRLVTPGGVVSTLAGSTAGFSNGTGAAARFSFPNGVAVLPDGNIVVADYNNFRIRLVRPDGVVTTLAGSGNWTFADGTGAAASFKEPVGVAVTSSGDIVVADPNNHRIRLVTYPGGVVTTLAGSGTDAFADGTGTAASFSSSQGVAVTPTGDVVVADTNNNRIRLIV
jgi:sugar lactone lactonase YvrE